MRRHGETYGRNLPRQRDLLCNRLLPFLDWAVEIYIWDLLTETGLRIDEFDQAVLDLEDDVRALINVFEEGTDCFDREILASTETERLAWCVLWVGYEYDGNKEEKGPTFQED